MWYDHALLIPRSYQLLIPRSYQVTIFPPFLLTIEEVSSDVDFCLTLSGPWGGGGLRGADYQTQSCQSETSYSMMPKLCEFYFLSLRNFSKISAALFSLRHPKKFENEKIFLCLKIAEIDVGVNFGLRRTILD